MNFSVYFKNHRYPIRDTNANGVECYEYVPEERTIITAETKEEAEVNFRVLYTDTEIQITDIVLYSH